MNATIYQRENIISNAASFWDSAQAAAGTLSNTSFPDGNLDKAAYAAANRKCAIGMKTTDRVKGMKSVHSRLQRAATVLRFRQIRARRIEED